MDQLFVNGVFGNIGRFKLASSSLTESTLVVGNVPPQQNLDFFSGRNLRRDFGRNGDLAVWSDFCPKVHSLHGSP